MEVILEVVLKLKMNLLLVT